MSLLSRTQVSNKLTHLIGLVLLCVGYFNSFLISEPISIFLEISYLTGQVLVGDFLAVCNYTVEIVTLIYSFFQIFYEDSLIFIKDATEKFTFVIFLCKECYLFLEKGVHISCSMGWDILKALPVVIEDISSLGTSALCAVASFKQTLHLVGSSIWHTISLIPEVLVNDAKAINDFVFNTISEITNSYFEFKNKICETIESMLYIPLDSVYGLFIGGVLVTIVCIKFKIICYLISRALFKLYKCFIRLGISLWSGRFLERRSKKITLEDDNRLCVVCQYQLKEIIIFPCKHLCMCWDCSIELVKLHRTCPICRTHIRETMKVYL